MMRQRNRRRPTSAKRIRKVVRVCTGEGFSVPVRDSIKVVSAMEKDSRNTARSMAGRKKITNGTNVLNMLWVRTTDKGRDLWHGMRKRGLGG